MRIPFFHLWLDPENTGNNWLYTHRDPCPYGDMGWITGGPECESCERHIKGGCMMCPDGDVLECGSLCPECSKHMRQGLCMEHGCNEKTHGEWAYCKNHIPEGQSLADVTEEEND